MSLVLESRLESQREIVEVGEIWWGGIFCLCTHISHGKYHYPAVQCCWNLKRIIVSSGTTPLQPTPSNSVIAVGQAGPGFTSAHRARGVYHFYKLFPLGEKDRTVRSEGYIKVLEYWLC